MHELQHNGEVCREKITCKCQWQPPSPRVYISGAQIDTPCAQLPHISVAQPYQDTLMQEVHTTQDWCRRCNRAEPGMAIPHKASQTSSTFQTQELELSSLFLRMPHRVPCATQISPRYLPENPLSPSSSSYLLGIPQRMVSFDSHWLHTSASSLPGSSTSLQEPAHGWTVSPATRIPMVTSSWKMTLRVPRSLAGAISAG